LEEEVIKYDPLETISARLEAMEKERVAAFIQKLRKEPIPLGKNTTDKLDAILDNLSSGDHPVTKNIETHEKLMLSFHNTVKEVERVSLEWRKTFGTDVTSLIYASEQMCLRVTDVYSHLTLSQEAVSLKLTCLDSQRATYSFEIAKMLKDIHLLSHKSKLQRTVIASLQLPSEDRDSTKNDSLHGLRMLKHENSQKLEETWKVESFMEQLDRDLTSLEERYYKEKDHIITMSTMEKELCTIFQYSFPSFFEEAMNTFGRQCSYDQKQENKITEMSMLLANIHIDRQRKWEKN
jgi:hypothetical protein